MLPLRMGNGKGNYKGRTFHCPKCDGNTYELIYIIGDSLASCLTCGKYTAIATSNKHWIKEEQDGTKKH